MTLPLELGGIQSPEVRRAFEQLAQQFPITVTGGGGGGAPSGPAGGDLGGTYPNPAVIKAQSGFTVGGVGVILSTDPSVTNARTPTAHHTTHEPGGSDPMAVDAAAATGSLRTLGTGATQATAGNDSRLTNARTPTAHATTHQPGGSDAMAVDAAAATGSLRTIGTGALQAAAGNDARFTDARTPTAHQTTHQSGNSDALTGNLDATARSNITKAGAAVGTRRGLNLIEGAGVTLTMADNAGSERVDVTINSSGGGGGGTVAIEGWHAVGGVGEPAFQNSWVNFGGAYDVASFKKMPDGTVRLKGTVKNGTAASAIFTLPVGYRPAAFITPAAANFNGSAYVDAGIAISSAGVVLHQTGSNVQVWLDGISFMAEDTPVSTLVFGGSSFVAQAKWFTD